MMKFSLATALMTTEVLHLCMARALQPLIDIGDYGEYGEYGESGGYGDEEQQLIYNALQRLDPNKLNLTIYWSCISTSYVYLSEYGAFQKDDTTYQQCQGDGHFLFERSCLHNLLVASNCFDGTWDCGQEWINNVEHVISWIDNTANAYPQCFTDYTIMDGYALTWDCEERCDLPCNYPEQFCTTITESYSYSDCDLQCATDHKGRRLSLDGHDMVLKLGNFDATPAETSPAPPTPASSDSLPTPGPSTPAPPNSLPTPAPPTPSTPAPPDASPTPSPPTPTTVISGSMRVNNVDYVALESNSTLKMAFETTCKNSIAAAVGTLAANIEVVLSSGSVVVTYSITVVSSASLAANTALTTSISGTLAADLVSSLSSIPGLSEVVVGSLSVTDFSVPHVSEVSPLTPSPPTPVGSGSTPAPPTPVPPFVNSGSSSSDQFDEQDVAYSYHQGSLYAICFTAFLVTLEAI